VVVAGGSGARFGGPKQFAPLAGRTVVEWSSDAAGAACHKVVLVLPAGSAKGKVHADVVVSGGASRAASVRAGLAAVPAGAELIVVHDAARPLSSPQLWAAVMGAVRQGADAALPCLAVADTIKQRQDDGHLVTLDRSRLLAAQTPQAFSAAALRTAHAGGAEATDDAALVESLGGRVVYVEGEPTNLKVTSPVDLVLAEALISAGALAHLRQPARVGPVVSP
jgi:2-C-methyl-D-erythritol 4-phosphate cytidylyltransferase